MIIILKGGIKIDASQATADGIAKAISSGSKFCTFREESETGNIEAILKIDEIQAIIPDNYHI
jgi:hypothetical protein